MDDRGLNRSRAPGRAAVLVSFGETTPEIITGVVVAWTQLCRWSFAMSPLQSQASVCRGTSKSRSRMVQDMVRLSTWSFGSSRRSLLRVRQLGHKPQLSPEPSETHGSEVTFDARSGTFWHEICDKNYRLNWEFV
jgi:hypothetical protein